MHKTSLLASSLLVTIGAAWGAVPPGSQDPGPPFQALAEEFRAAQEAHFRRFDSGAEAADGVARYRDWPGWSFAPRFLALAEAHPGEPAAADALFLILRLGGQVPDVDRELLPIYERALALILRDHLGDPRAGRACLEFAKSPTPPRERFLVAAREKAAAREVRGKACYGLARTYMARRENFYKLRSMGDREKTPAVRYIEGRWDPGYRAYLRDLDPDEFAAEAGRLFSEVIRDYGDLRYTPRIADDAGTETLGAMAEQDLYELKNLSVGSRAPEIEGEDLDGKPMKLSDFRGRVVVLSFWATWCGPCLALVPHERGLVRRFAGRPFTLVGVDEDEDRRRAKETASRHEMTWRSWWDGRDEGGPIATRWNIRGWPTIYVLDREGVIRYKGVQGEALERAIEALLGETSLHPPR